LSRADSQGLQPFEGDKENENVKLREGKDMGVREITVTRGDGGEKAPALQPV